MSDSDKTIQEMARARAAGVTGSDTTGRRRWRTAGYTLGVTACLLFMVFGTVFGHFYWGSKTFHDMFPKMMGSLLTGHNPLDNWTVEKQFPDRTSMNVLILGVDYDYDNYNRVVRAGARSDSIMIAHVDFVNRTIGALTIPRDTAVNIPGRRGIHKINAAHAFGGPDLTIETIKSVFGVTADAYVVVNFEGFQKIVDAIGGIDVNVEKKLDYDDNWGHLHIHLKPGYQHMNGYQAMGYVRMRHSDSDEMRSRRQHNFLEAMRNKIKQPGTFMALPRVIDRLNENFKRGNLSEDQLFALANFARSLEKERVGVTTLPSFEGPSYVTINTEKSAELIQKMFFPNQYVALNIDAPDPNHVRSMNAPYERGHRRHSRRRSERTQRAEPKRETPPVTGDLSVEETPAPESSKPESAPPPAESGTDSGGGSGEGTDNGSSSG